METERAKETDKPMERSRIKILRTAREYLVTDMDAEQVLIKMPLVFTSADEEEIKSMPTRQQKSFTFLNILPRRGNNAFDVFKKALEEVSPHLISTLNQAAETTRERQKSAGLEGKLRSLQNKMEKIANERDELKKQLDRKSAETTKERQKSAGLEGKLRSLQKEKKKITNEVDELKRQLGRKSTEITKERQKSAGLQRKLRFLKKEKKKITNKLHELKKQLDRKSTTDLNQEPENSARLALECQDLKVKLEKEKEESKKIVDERDELRN